MNAATLTLLSKAVADMSKTVREDLTVGKHNVDETVTLHVSGLVTVGEDYDQRIVLKADPWTLLQAALSHLNGVTVESLVREALTADPKMLKSIKESAQEAMEAINAPTMTACKGKVTTKGGAEVVTMNPGLAIAA